MTITCHKCKQPYEAREQILSDGLRVFTCPWCGAHRLTKSKKIASDLVDAAKFYNGYKYDPKRASDLVDAATYGYRYVQDQGSAFHKACELSKKLKKHEPKSLKEFYEDLGLSPYNYAAHDCTGWAYYDNEPVFLTKKLHIPEYKGEMNMKNVAFEEKQTLRICRERNEWRDIYTVADTEPTDLFALCSDPNMRVYMRVAMDEDTFLVKDPNMRPVLDVQTGCIEMMDKDEKIFVYDPFGCNLDVGSFMNRRSHED